MQKHHARRLTRPLFTLILLVVALAATASSPPAQKASAYPCEQCEVMYEHCMSVCYPCTPAQEYNCEMKRSNCWADCD